MKSKQLSTRLTGSDWFCGAGGSSEGAVMAGLEMVAAANHWPLAIETHNTNHPNVNHYLTNLSQADPRYFPQTNFLIASPECTNHSLAKGRKRKNIAQMEMFDPSKIDPSEERSRATMWCVPRFAEYHNYDVIVVENVVDIRYWVTWDAWLHAMDLLGYSFETCYFNSMFFNPVNGLSDYAPQSRDRIYIVFWKKGNQKPALDFRPEAWCSHCESKVRAVQSWKNLHKRWGRYGERRQYVYRCPNCTEMIEPYYYAAYNAIDWSIKAPRIGDRDRPLKPKTLKRIKLGLKKYGKESFTVELAHSHCTHPENRVHPLTYPMPTQTTWQTLAFIISMRDSPHYPMYSIKKPLPTQSTVGAPYIVELFGSSTARSILEPMGCITAGGINYGVVQPQPFLISYYGGSDMIKDIIDPIPTISTVDRHSLVVPEPDLNVEDCGFRMIQPHEVKDGMGFEPGYVLLGNKHEQVRLAGNAVTPPVMEWIVKQCMETFK